MIHVENLVKWYGPTRAVNDISFDVPEGQIVGFLGPNGAGKSTTIRMLTGYLPPTSGTASIAGFDAMKDSEKARRQIGYLPESTPLYLEMRVEEFLHFRGKLMDMPRADRVKAIDYVSDRCGLSAIRRRVIGQLSKGNRQRVGIAQALLHDPKVLILDEPTSGLDPVQIGAVRTLIQELKGKHTILLSSHILPEVEKTADRVIIIAAGTIKADGSPADLRQKVGQGASVLVQVKANSESVQKAFTGVEGVKSVTVEKLGEWTKAVVQPRPGTEVREKLGQTLLTNGWAIREMRNETASLEQFFIQITADQSQVVEESAVA
jgi:ABC-2 type transport system ATP-binding protein